MERESFEDQETADILNKHFISVKVCDDDTSARQQTVTCSMH